MGNDRETSRQKRARQNRARRAALEARTKAASAPSRTAPAAPVTKDADPGGASAGTKKRGWFASAREARGPRPGDVPVELDQLEGGWFAKRVQVPGGRQVLTGGVLTIVMSALMLWWKFPPADDLDGEATESLFDLVGAWAIVVIAVPLVSMAIASQFTLSPHRRRIWIGASLVIAVEVVMGFSVYLFPVGFLTYALWRSSKVEGPARLTRAERRAAAAADETNDRSS